MYRYNRSGLIGGVEPGRHRLPSSAEYRRTLCIGGGRELRDEYDSDLYGDPRCRLPRRKTPGGRLVRHWGQPVRGGVEAVSFAPNGATAMVVYLGLFPAAVGYVLWARVLAVLPASKAATALFLVPPLSLLIAWAWLHEVPTLLGVVGGVLALTGVGLVRESDCGIRVWGRSVTVPDPCENKDRESHVCVGEPCGCGAANAPVEQPC